jgi:two-component system OmpR family response regulator/two-component system response regulator QseB
MIIEAENLFRKNLYRCLQAEGFTVVKLTQQDDVETIIAKEKIDVVLLGLDGLGKEGLSLIGLIKSVSPMTKIIILNDPKHMDLSIVGMDLGAFDDFLIPLDIDALAARIREASKRKD